MDPYFLEFPLHILEKAFGNCVVSLHRFDFDQNANYSLKASCHQAPSHIKDTFHQSNVPDHSVDLYPVEIKPELEIQKVTTISVKNCPTTDFKILLVHDEFVGEGWTTDEAGNPIYYANFKENIEVNQKSEEKGIVLKNVVTRSPIKNEVTPNDVSIEVPSRRNPVRIQSTQKMTQSQEVTSSTKDFDVVKIKTTSNARYVTVNGRYKCTCGDLFAKAYGLTRHISRKKCPAYQINQKNGKTTISVCTPSEVLSQGPKCVHCGLVFAKDYNLRRHLANKSCRTQQRYKDGRPICTNCNMQFKSAETLKIHFQKCKDQTVGRLKCLACGVEFKNATTLKRHHRFNRCKGQVDKGDGDPKVFKTCLDCGMQFRYNYSFNRHRLLNRCKGNARKSVVDENKNVTVVNVKVETPTTKVVVNSDTSPRPITGRNCIPCGVKFSSFSALQRHHESIHLGIKNFKCTTCGSKFTRKESLQNHMKSHQGSAFKCSICYKGFSNKGILDKHMHFLHSKSQKRTSQLSCRICREKFDRTTLLTSHFRTSHPGQTVLECNICKAGFSYEPNLRLHMSRFHPKRG